MKLSELVLRYALFAAIATVVNLGVQRGVLAFGTGPVLFVGALGAGTMAGLMVKYVLDKKWIFYAVTKNMAEDSKRFTLYTAMGLVTTAIFWGMETAFWVVWQTKELRELGAILGLAIGYVVKYRLDRRFVFRDIGANAS